MSKLLQFTFRLTEEEKEQISLKAKEQGISSSKYVREKALEEDISNREIIKTSNRHTIYILKAINKKNGKINKVLDLAYELLQDDSNKDLFESNQDFRGGEEEHHLMDSMIKILVTKLSIVESENKVAEDNSREYTIKVLNELIKTFIELKREVI